MSRKDTDEIVVRRIGAARSQIDSFIVMDVMRAAAASERSGRHIIHMEVGQPGTPAPERARTAVAAALEKEALGYSLALGLPLLREKVAELYQQQHGLEIDPERVVITTGSSGAFVLAFLALFDAGARVALPQPGYPCYRHILSALGCEPVFLKAGPETRWMPRAEDISATADLQGVLLASPANPTGTMLEPSRLAAIVEVCEAKGITFISDEIYHGLTYERQAESALRYSDRAVVINSFSKYFSMTGWRIGWMVVPNELVRTVERLAQNFFIAPPTVSQVAALGAFESADELEANRQVYARNRELLLNELPAAGFNTFAPADGAFYLYADTSHLGDDSAVLARRILNDAGVAVTPGSDFDFEHGRYYIRFSYSGTHAEMIEGARRLRAWRQAR